MYIVGQDPKSGRGKKYEFDMKKWFRWNFGEVVHSAGGVRAAAL